RGDRVANHHGQLPPRASIGPAPLPRQRQPGAFGAEEVIELERREALAAVESGSFLSDQTGEPGLSHGPPVDILFLGAVERRAHTHHFPSIQSRPQPGSSRKHSPASRSSAVQETRTVWPARSVRQNRTTSGGGPKSKSGSAPKASHQSAKSRTAPQPSNTPHSSRPAIQRGWTSPAGTTSASARRNSSSTRSGSRPEAIEATSVAVTTTCFR